MAKKRMASRVTPGKKTAAKGAIAFFKNKWNAVWVVAAFMIVGGATLWWAQAATVTTSLWSLSTVPKVITWQDNQSVEVGVKFKAAYAGYVTGVRFYKGPQNTGTHVGSLWTGGGKELARATFTGESATGWQSVTFAKPVAVSANTTYVVSYFAPKGYYSADAGYFNAQHQNNDKSLTAPSGSNGIYTYTSKPAFPNKSYGSTNYWVDVTYATQLLFPTPKPAAPTNVAAKMSGSNVVVTWGASASTGIASYTILRNGAPYATVGNGAVQYTDTAVSPGQTYSYQVQAVDGGGTTSALSASASVTIPAAPAPAPTPTPTPAPTPSPTPTPTPPQTGAIGCTTYAAGSTAAGCNFPTGSNTGVPQSKWNSMPKVTTAKDVGWVITQDGAVIDGQNINGWIDVEANNVTIQNSVITSNNWWGIRYGASNTGVTGLRVVGNTIQTTPGQGPDNGGYDYGVSQEGSGTMEVAFNDISGFKDGIDVADGNVHNNYVHDLSQFSGAHTQDVYVWCGGKNGVTLANNTFINQTQLANSTAAVYIAPDCGQQNNVFVFNNWLAGGALTFYGGGSNATNIRVQNNAFSTEIAKDGGYYGATGYWPGTGTNGNVWTNNVWANGGSANQQITP